MSVDTLTGAFAPSGAVRKSGARSLPVFAFWRAATRNAIEAWPDAVYAEHDVRLRIAHREVIVATAPETVARILNDRSGGWDISNFQRRQFAPVLGDGLIAAEIEASKIKRTEASARLAASPREKLPGYVLGELDAFMGSAGADLERALGRFTLRLLIKALFSADADAAPADIVSLFERWVRQLEKISLPAAVGLTPLALAETAPLRVEVARHTPMLCAFLGARDTDALGRRAFLTAALNLLAGYKTTSLATLWAITALSRQSADAAKIAAEAAAWRAKGSTLDALGEARFTAAFFAETVRLFPPFPFLLREAIRADPELGVKRGAVALVAPWIIHRHRRLWDAPAQFRAERFLGQAPASMSYMPFGAGPRRCIGAILGERIALITLLEFAARGRLNVSGDAEPSASFLLRPAGVLRLAVEPRG